MIQYRQHTYQSPFWPKRWIHRWRFRDATKLIALAEDDTVLDFGCGDGHFLKLLAEILPSNHLYGYEPGRRNFQQASNNLNSSGVLVVQQLDSLTKRKFTKIYCLETCEHLPDAQLEVLLENIETMLADKGNVLIGVPIEIGLPALLKNTFRLWNPKAHHLTVQNYFKAFLGQPIARKAGKLHPDLKYIFPHVGFDYRRFEQMLGKYFNIRERRFSPTPLFGSLLNNEVYYICERGHSDG